ncbi:NAD(P)H-dependent flavin oxidoreductase [Isoalcanivorax beigongshangi]|uniref:Propionate 3-nitronate monooxygenase n=1 Tax=Isoalcanivorax beigongshangi TaxID=3238810 RepID=A0ABV4AJK7_9GAMM
MTDLAKWLGIQWPLIQAPMAGVQDQRLALAVCQAGGLGSLPAAAVSLEALSEQVAALRAVTAAPFNVNFFAHTAPAEDAVADQAWLDSLAGEYQQWQLPRVAASAAPRQPFNPLAADWVSAMRPAVVSFHFGLPAPALLAQVKAAGAKVLASATTVAEAQWLVQHGADAVIAQGWEAGGHRGHFLDADVSRQLGTFALVPQIAAAVAVPVIAAGGITDAATVAAARRLGAAGVQVGTAFLRTPEATTTALHRSALASDRPTLVTHLYSGRPARAIATPFLEQVGPLAGCPAPFPRASAAILPLRKAAEAHGDDRYTSMWSGQNRSGCRALPAAEICRALAAGWDVPAG